LLQSNTLYEVAEENLVKLKHVLQSFVKDIHDEYCNKNVFVTPLNITKIDISA